jgi:hypothetical protein
MRVLQYTVAVYDTYDCDKQHKASSTAAILLPAELSRGLLRGAVNELLRTKVYPQLHLCKAKQVRDATQKLLDDTERR